MKAFLIVGILILAYVFHSWILMGLGLGMAVALK